MSTGKEHGMDLTAIALGGVERAQGDMGRAARKLAAGFAGTENARDAVDLTALAVELSTARRSFEANLAVLAAADEMAEHSLDILA